MRALLLLTVLLLTGHLTAAVPETAADAVALITAAKAAALESDSKPERIVDAAVAFSEALTWYEKQGDIDKICDLEANIFWCKKRMDVAGITAFVALKSGKAGAAQALTKVEAVATRSVEVSQAQTFFDRAQHFATQHPEDDLQISVRLRSGGTLPGQRRQSQGPTPEPGRTATLGEKPDQRHGQTRQHRT